MTNDKDFNYEQSLQLINTMIHKAKNSFLDTGIGAMLWGAVISICSLVKFAESFFGFRLPFDIFFLALVAIIPQMFITFREKRYRKAKSYDDSYINYVWLGFGICIFLLIHVINLMFASWAPVFYEYKTLTGHEAAFQLSEFSSPLFLILYGLPTFVTGAVCKFKPMFWGGIIFWMCSIVTVYTSYQADLLITAGAALTGWFVPGLLMKKEYTSAKKREAVAHV